MSKSRFRDDNFAQRFRGTKKEFKAAYNQRMKDKYGSVTWAIFWFVIQRVIEYLWRKYHAN